MEFRDYRFTRGLINPHMKTRGINLITTFELLSGIILVDCVLAEGVCVRIKMAFIWVGVVLIKRSSCNEDQWFPSLWRLNQSTVQFFDGAPEKCILPIQFLYVNSRNPVRFYGDVSSEYMTRSVDQGCLLSPFFVNYVWNGHRNSPIFMWE